jgi:S1-C subfamily serine protease
MALRVQHREKWRRRVTFQSLKRLIVTLSIIFCAVVIIPAKAQDANQSAQSVVRISCRLSNGDEKPATGFVWRDQSNTALDPNFTYVVTVLHAVAGCDRIIVSSESGYSNIATPVASHHEADLALLKLAGTPTMPALQHSSSLPNIDEDHFVWGYPRSQTAMIRADVDLSRGYKETTTLGRLFKTRKDFEDQIGGQSYPGFEATIIQVSSTLVHGHSGAPIVDNNGRVVAIADGGLHDGVTGINWSIPAAEYLPMLAASEDKFPDTEPKIGALMSAPREARTVEFELQDEVGAQGGDDRGGKLEHVGTIAITDLEVLLPDAGYDWAIYDSDADWIETVSSALDARTPEDQIDHIDYYLDNGLPGAAAQALLTCLRAGVLVNTCLTGRFGYNYGAIDDGDPDWIASINYDLAARTLEERVLYIDEYLDDGLPLEAAEVLFGCLGDGALVEDCLTADPGGYEDGLTTEEYREILSYIQEEAEEVGVNVNDLYIDVYENYETGATIAVPAHLDLIWDDENSVLGAFNADGTVGMLVIIKRLRSFPEASSTLLAFLNDVTGLTNWDVDGSDEDFDTTEEWRWVDLELLGKNDTGLDTAEASVSADIEGSDLLAIASFAIAPTQYESIDEMSNQNWIDYYLLWMCESLTEFPTH